MAKNHRSCGAPPADSTTAAAPEAEAQHSTTATSSGKPAYPPSHIDPEAVRDLLCEAEFLMAAAGSKEWGAAIERRDEIQKLPSDDSKLVIRNARESIGVLARTALPFLRTIERNAPGILAGGGGLGRDQSRFVRAFERLLIDVPESSNPSAPAAPIEAISLHGAIEFLQKVARWGKPLAQKPDESPAQAAAPEKAVVNQEGGGSVSVQSMAPGDRKPNEQGEGDNRGRPAKKAGRGGRPPSWNDLYEIIKKEDLDGTPDERIANKYNQQYGRPISEGKKKKANAKIVARVRCDYRNRVANITELNGEASRN